MHITDGVLHISVVVATSVGAAAVLAYSFKGIKEYELTRVSLLAGAFFVSSLIHIPIGPTSVHPVLAGLLGLLLGRRAPVGIFMGLLLQALLFQHGGLTTLGTNLLIMSFPALTVYWASRIWHSKHNRLFIKGFLSSSIAIILGVTLLIITLILSNQLYAEGTFSVVNMIILSYIPLLFIEGILTGFVLKFLYSVRPQIFNIMEDAQARD